MKRREFIKVTAATTASALWGVPLRGSEDPQGVFPLRSGDPPERVGWVHFKTNAEGELIIHVYLDEGLAEKTYSVGVWIDGYLRRVGSLTTDKNGKARGRFGLPVWSEDDASSKDVAVSLSPKDGEGPDAATDTVTLTLRTPVEKKKRKKKTKKKAKKKVAKKKTKKKAKKKATKKKAKKKARKKN